MYKKNVKKYNIYDISNKISKMEEKREGDFVSIFKGKIIPRIPSVLYADVFYVFLSS